MFPPSPCKMNRTPTIKFVVRAKVNPLSSFSETVLEVYIVQINSTFMHTTQPLKTDMSSLIWGHLGEKRFNSCKKEFFWHGKYCKWTLNSIRLFPQILFTETALIFSLVPLSSALVWINVVCSNTIILRKVREIFHDTLQLDKESPLLAVPLCNSAGSNISSYPFTVIKTEKKIKTKQFKNYS